MKKLTGSYTSHIGFFNVKDTSYTLFISPENFTKNDIKIYAQNVQGGSHAGLHLFKTDNLASKNFINESFPLCDDATTCRSICMKDYKGIDCPESLDTKNATIFTKNIEMPTDPEKNFCLHPMKDSCNFLNIENAQITNNDDPIMDLINLCNPLKNDLSNIDPESGLFNYDCNKLSTGYVNITEFFSAHKVKDVPKCNIGKIKECSSEVKSYYMKWKSSPNNMTKENVLEDAMNIATDHIFDMKNPNQLPTRTLLLNSQLADYLENFASNTILDFTTHMNLPASCVPTVNYMAKLGIRPSLSKESVTAYFDDCKKDNTYLTKMQKACINLFPANPNKPKKLKITRKDDKPIASQK